MKKFHIHKLTVMSSPFYNGFFISTWFESIECVLFFVCENFVSTWFPFSFNEPNMVIIMKNNFMDKRWMNTMKLCFLMKNMQYIIYKYFYLLSRVYNRYWRHYLLSFRGYYWPVTCAVSENRFKAFFSSIPFKHFVNTSAIKIKLLF